MANTFSNKTLKYVVGYIIVNITDQEDDAMLRFILFEDGTVFEFYGNFGSLRNHIKIDKNIATEIMKLETYTYDFNTKIKEEMIYTYLQHGLLSIYTTHIDCIEKCCLLESKSANIFIKRMLNHEMIYSHSDSLDLFNIYKNYFEDYIWP